MNPLAIFGYTAVTLALVIVTLTVTLALVDRTRSLLYRTAIDIIEIAARFNQMRNDAARASAELEARQDRHAARLEAWQQRARIRLTAQRQQLIENLFGE